MGNIINYNYTIMQGDIMKYREFFMEHPVFTLDEFRNFVKNKCVKSGYNSLKYYINKGTVQIIKRGLYYVVPEGRSPDKFKPSSILIASRLSEKSVLGFHTALDVMGYGHSVFHRFFYYASKRKRKFNFKEDKFICVKTPESLKKKNLAFLGVNEEYFQNLTIKFTNRERTLVDCLDRPDYGGGIEEIYRSVEKYSYLKFEELLKYLYARSKKILFAKVGFFLEQHKKQFYVEQNFLDKLHKEQPSSVVYFNPKRKEGKLVKSWNLVVPENVIKKGWEEF